MSKRAKI